MNFKSVFILFACISAAPCWSFTCYYTLAKDSCWSNYNVSVDVYDAAANTKLFTVSAPKGQQWGRQEFECQPDQKLMSISSFSPIFWQQDKGKTYQAQRFGFLPSKINPGDSAWNVSVCFAGDFASVPLPPEADSNCHCDFASIPAIPPKQIPAN